MGSASCCCKFPATPLIFGFLALFAFVLGGALFTPLVLLLLMRLLTPVSTAAFGILGRMAPRAVIRSLSRTAIAVAALTVAVSVIVGVSVMIGSFRGTVANWLDTTLGADIYVSPPLITATRSTVDVDPAILDQSGAGRGRAAHRLGAAGERPRAGLPGHAAGQPQRRAAERSPPVRAASPG